jgi:redox-sensitive bicupin YhaK (pirin superfamily)
MSHHDSRFALERITASSAVVGEGFTVRRAVPTKARRMVGAWCFLDHVGPADFAAGHGMNVGPHPHIGLQTFTWMIEGEILHRDSLGYEQIIRPGQVNLMTAGNGIAHSEESLNNDDGRLHITQLWIALPEAERQCAPDFKHYPDLPIIDSDDFRITLLVGSAFNVTAPTQVYTPLIGMDIKTVGPAKTNLVLDPEFEHAVLCLNGAMTVEGEKIEPGTLLYLGLGRHSISIQADAASQLLLIGGEPFKENILMWWNFVARSPDEMIRATEDWNTHKHFADVKNSPLKRLIAPDPSSLHLRT